MAVVYIGECNSDGTNTGTPSITTFGIPTVRTKNRTFTAPGTGSDFYDIVSLAGWVDHSSGAGNDVRVALYRNSDLALVAEGDAAVQSLGNDPGWAGHPTAGDITQSLQVQGGVAYVLAITDCTGTWAGGYYSGSSGDSAYILSPNYLSGYPDPYDTSSEVNASLQIVLRAGIELAAAPGNPWYAYAQQ